MVVTNEYLKEHGFICYKDDKCRNKYESYIWQKSVKVGHNDVLDEDIYHEERINICKSFTKGINGETIVKYELRIIVRNPSMYKEDINFSHHLDANKELTVEYLETLRNAFGI